MAQSHFREALIAWHALVLEARLEAARRGRGGGALAAAQRRVAPLVVDPGTRSALDRLQSATSACVATPAPAHPCASAVMRRAALGEAAEAAAAVLPPVPPVAARSTLRFRADIDG